MFPEPKLEQLEQLLAEDAETVEEVPERAQEETKKDLGSDSTGKEAEQPGVPADEKADPPVDRDDADDDTITRIPIGRLNKEIAKRRKLAEEVERLSKELEAARATTPRKEVPPPEADPFEGLFDDVDDAADKSADARLEELLAWKRETQNQRQVDLLAERMLQSLNAAHAEYPDVTKEELSKVLLQNPDADLMESASAISTYRLNLREGAVKAWLEEQGLTREQIQGMKGSSPDRPRTLVRPKTAGSSTRTAPKEGADTIEGGTKRLIALLNESM